MPASMLAGTVGAAMERRSAKCRTDLLRCLRMSGHSPMNKDVRRRRVPVRKPQQRLRSPPARLACCLSNPGQARGGGRMRPPPRVGGVKVPGWRGAGSFSGKTPPTLRFGRTGGRPLKETPCWPAGQGFQPLTGGWGHGTEQAATGRNRTKRDKVSSRAGAILPARGKRGVGARRRPRM